MVIGIGTDLVEIARIENFWQNHQAKFAEKLLSEQELVEFAKVKFKVKFLAKRWVAKEAIAKALGTGISQGITFSQMHIAHDEHGKPLVELAGAAKERANWLAINDWQLSISDEKHYAVAYVIAQKI